MEQRRSSSRRAIRRWSRWAATLSALTALAAASVIVSVPATPVFAISVSPINLGRAAPFAILAGDSVGNTATGPTTIVRGDLGVLAAAGLVTGFPPGEVHGIAYASGAAAVVNAHADLVAAYANAAARPSNFGLTGDLIGLTLHPGVHTNSGAIANTGTVTLDGDGDPDAVFIFQVGGALSMAAASKVILTNGTQAKNVFWQVNGAGAVGADAQFAGTLMTSAAIGVGANSLFNGRALAKTGAITTNSNQFFSAPPVVMINGGATVSVADDTPTISGTAVVDVPATVTVTVDTQTLMTPVQVDGTWAVTAGIMANGIYSVEASVDDLAGNTGSANQSLTIDTVLPVVTINGGSARLTNDSTPTIDGTTDVAPGTLVTVTVAGQTLIALVQAAGTWNITPTPVADGVALVVVAVLDDAGNPGSTTQSLTVDTIPPGVIIDGGANALTNDPTPTIGGTSTDPGAALTVTVSGVATPATVHVDGTWSVTTAMLSNGLHPVSVSVTDPAGNIGTALQSLTVDTNAPGISINGGANASTTDTTPTITGMTLAAPGSIVTVTIAGQTLTTLVQANGSWNITPTALSVMAYNVVATVSDPAGNTSTATQTLTVTTTTPSGTSFTSLVPARLLESRSGLSTIDGQFNGIGMRDAGTVTALTVVGRGGVSGDAAAVVLNVTVTEAQAAGFLTVYSCGTARPNASSLNYVAGSTVANAVIVKVGDSGQVCIFNQSATHLLADINGYFQP